MKRSLIALACVAVWVGCEPPETADELPDDPAVAPEAPAPAFVDEGPPEPLTFQPDDIEWQDGPGSLDEGAEYAVLEGDPGAEALFTMRIRMPDGFRINPHTHPAVERVTIISGTFHLGHGEAFDRGAATGLEPGSHFSIPSGHPHFAEMEGETVIQLSSIGPWEIQYVNPEHDPRD